MLRGKANRARDNQSHQANTSSHKVDRFRLRSDGVLKQPEIDWCRENNIPLAYDPVQIGWVTLECEDDISRNSAQLTAGSIRRPASPARQNTEAYSFRRWRADDAPNLARMLSSPNIWRYLPEDFAGRVDVTSAEQLIELNNAADHHYVCAVEYSGELIGQVRLEFQSPTDTEAEISYWLDEAHWGKGHGSAMVSKFTEETLRDRPKLERLFALVHKENTASARLLQKSGFRQSNVEMPDSSWVQFELNCNVSGASQA